MRKSISLSILILVCNFVVAQNKEEAEKLVAEGVAFHDKGDYTAAIARYDKALILDKDNLLAMTEKAFSLLSQQKIEESISYCQQAIEKHPGDKGLKTVYVTYGNALDALNKTGKAVEVYDEGIKQFPGYYQLYFNKGITLTSAGKYDEALLCFQKSVMLNPAHAGSHNAIGRILNATGKRIASLLAYCRFLVIESQTGRAKENLESVQTIMKGDAKETGKNSVSINFNPGMLGDTTTDGKHKENSFSTVDMILTMTAALDYDKENKNKSEVEKFIRKFESVCSSLEETKKDNYGFYWDYYVPYFIEMKNKNLIETFAYLAFAPSNNADVSKWLNAHQAETDKFFEWSNSFSWKQN